MKRSLFIASICAIALTLAAGYDSGARKEGPNKPTIENISSLSTAQVAINKDFSSVVSPYVIAEILGPKLESNFNRLVTFPELGTNGEESGFAAIIRGPPKIFS